ncbi:hypothetical protein PFNF135_04335 [Plasmodium falciparum NF135/5.C10]|uniref:Uncharacterized protein n=2 Tax=Plasmodium falciparum TaxID=5833 RepID=A0A024V496_PLAFA|nr:hypothetical protein PFFVO_03790 [Plasmodium falciparum Vietnam Oak-Knoll (FVO)]ETW41350.1 hypothetical protein PFNF135_04335 [Plasmodium falciparum NF135/5.C10]
MRSIYNINIYISKYVKVQKLKNVVKKINTFMLSNILMATNISSYILYIYIYGNIQESNYIFKRNFIL